MMLRRYDNIILRQAFGGYALLVKPRAAVNLVV